MLCNNRVAELKAASFCAQNQRGHAACLELECLDMECLLGKKAVLSSCLHYKDEILRNALQELKDTQEKLLSQEKKAVIGELTTDLVHEIKNLLNPIGFLELIKDEVSAENQKYIKYIYHSRSRILELIENICLLAKDEESKRSS